MEVSSLAHAQKQRAIRSSVCITHALQYHVQADSQWHSLELLDQLSQCHESIWEFRKDIKNLVYPTPTLTSRQNGVPSRRAAFAEEVSYRKKLKLLTSPPVGEAMDARIKVAIIDNGADKIRSSIKNSIAKGVSYVTGGPASGDRILPWWMVSDPHGTQMASLIAKANPFCRLYIARVGKLRQDILAENAAAVRNALPARAKERPHKVQRYANNPPTSRPSTGRSTKRWTSSPLAGS